jgi:hypothetical protein
MESTTNYTQWTYSSQRLPPTLVFPSSLSSPSLPPSLSSLFSLSLYYLSFFSLFFLSLLSLFFISLPYVSAQIASDTNSVPCGRKFDESDARRLGLSLAFRRVHSFYFPSNFLFFTGIFFFFIYFLLLLFLPFFPSFFFTLSFFPFFLVFLERK